MNKSNSDKLKKLALKGYKKLAFGSSNDAIKLLFLNESDSNIFASLDFFNISEIRKPKDGSMEIKFFDRLKALEKIVEFSNENDDSVYMFYKALEENAKDMKKGKDNNED
jgi:hypothetical protein